MPMFTNFDTLQTTDQTCDPEVPSGCSSFAVNPVWQAAFHTINFANESDRRQLPEDDFRCSSPAFFESILVLCLSSQLNVNSLTTLFENSRMISALALPRKLKAIFHGSLIRPLLEVCLRALSYFLGRNFESNIQSYFRSFTSDHATKLANIHAVGHLSTVVNSAESGMRFQTLTVNGKPSMRRYSPAPPAFNVCACQGGNG